MGSNRIITSRIRKGWQVEIIAPDGLSVTVKFAYPHEEDRAIQEAHNILQKKRREYDSRIRTA